ncbi:choice-of-anchor J domain-containing protein [Flavobacterium sp. PLA-1-15]|uniref:choice-of-anchor J domain-containing protein n=1 Tax=Flavobacterium sp. PLA-1-15 TaxID=3380533 RepID=UPI003B7E2657
MKKIILAMLAVIGCNSISSAQCINTQPNPTEIVQSNNSGDPQEINSCVFATNYSTVTNITAGLTYTFSLKLGGEELDKYITVTDLQNNTIAQGSTPLVVNDISSPTVRVHYAEDQDCTTVAEPLCYAAFIKVTLSCHFPSDILISGVTTTNATFSWVPGGDETAWQILVLEKGSDAPTPATQGTPVDGEPEYSVNNLEVAHQYDFYVRADCEDEYSPWRGPYSFNSECNPIDSFSENFDNATEGELPSCWTALKVNATADANISINSLSNSNPNAVMLANADAPATAGIYLVSPKLATVTTASHRVKFYTRGYGNVTLQVGTISAATADATFTSLATINATPNYTEHIVDFTGYEGTDTYIAFRHANLNSYNPVFIDDVRWEEAPSCPDVQNIEMMALTPSSATIGWSAGNTATQWDIVYSETGTDPSLLTPIAPAPTEPEGTITGLQADTAYKAWVRSSCDGEVGAWSNPINFRTSCLATATLDETFESAPFWGLPECWSAIVAEGSVLNSTVRVQSGNAATGNNAVALSNNDEGTNSKIILVAPNLNTLATSTHRVKFYAKANVPAELEVGTLSSPATGATFTAFEPLDITTSYAEYVVDFSSYSGSNTYIGFKHASGQYVTIHIDNVRWEETPSCLDVTNIQVSNLTPSTAFVNWQENAGETSWDIVYGTADVTNPNSLTPITPAPTGDSEATLSGLTDNTSYKLWVRSLCGGTDGNGAWIGPIPFKTPCLPTATLNEGFENAVVGNLPDCWSSILAGPTLAQYAAVRTVSNDAAFGSNAVELHVNSSEPTDLIMLVSPYLSTLPNATHRLKFYALSYNSETPLQIGTLNGTSSSATYTLFQPITLGSGYNEYIVDFTTYSGTDNYIAFRNVAGNYNSTFIDNVRWEILPTCPDVTSIQLDDVEAESASISWTAGGAETNWQVVYGPNTVSDPNTLVPSDLLTQNNFLLQNLQDNAFTNVWVRSVCGGADGNGAWIGPLSFKTRCLPTTIPYTQDFQSITFPNLPDCSITEKTGAGNNWQTNFGDSGYGFDGFVLQYSGNTAAANAWYFTQDVELTEGIEYTISYKYGNNSNDNFIESMQVAFGTEANAGSMLTEIADHPEINTGTAMINEVLFTPTQTAAYYIGFLAYSAASQGNLFLDDINITTPLGTPVNSVSNLNFYPNPVKDILTITNKEEITSVTIFNLLGQKVQETALNTTTASIDMSNLATGSYIAKIMANNQIRTIKLIKE